MLIFPWIKLSWHSCSMWDKPEWLNWFWQFLYERLSSFDSLIWKNSWSHSLCEGRTSLCTGLINRKLCTLIYVFDWLYSTQCITSFFSISCSSSFCTVFGSISSNIDEVLLINHLLCLPYVLDFNVHHKDWFTYSGGTAECNIESYDSAWNL